MSFSAEEFTGIAPEPTKSPETLQGGSCGPKPESLTPPQSVWNRETEQCLDWIRVHYKSKSIRFTSEQLHQFCIGYPIRTLDTQDCSSIFGGLYMDFGNYPIDMDATAYYQYWRELGERLEWKLQIPEIPESVKTLIRQYLSEITVQQWTDRLAYKEAYNKFNALLNQINQLGSQDKILQEACKFAAENEMLVENRYHDQQLPKSQQRYRGR